MNEKKVVTYVEIDLEMCSLTYGTSPCTATLSGGNPTGTKKCFNALNTCQDKDNYDGSVTKTIRFAVASGYLPPDIEILAACIPGESSIQVTPGRIEPGQSLGQRTSVSITLEDFMWSDTEPFADPYLSDRSYVPARQGTFWSKMRERHPYLQGRALRIVRGYLGQTYAQMTKRHYVIESISGPNASGQYSIVAKDVLKLLDGDRALAPAVSSGYTNIALDDTDTEFNLLPTGIGDEEYPSSGYVCIGGNEVCGFTRSGDTMTITRGQLGTTAKDHSAEDRVQVALRYTGEDVADIIQDLMENYANVDSSFIPIADWLAETEAFLRVNYTATITEPTSVRQLVSELIEQAGLIVYQNDVSQFIKLQVLRKIDTTADLYTTSDMISGSFSVADQPNKRLSEVHTYYGQLDPTENVKDKRNYRSMVRLINQEADRSYPVPMVLEVFSRWIPAFARQIAERTNSLHMGRYVKPPREIRFSVPRGDESNIELGGGYQLEHPVFQTDEGAPYTMPIQVVSLDPKPSENAVVAEEFNFEDLQDFDLVNRVVTINSGAFNFKFRDVYNAIYGEDFPDVGTWSAGTYNEDDIIIHEGDFWQANTTTTEEPSDSATDWDLYIRITCRIETNVIVGSLSTSLFAFDVQDWPDHVIPRVINLGRVQGRAGNGGKGRYEVGTDPDRPASDGTDGGPALYCRHEVLWDNSAGEIWSGGGGGGGGGATKSFWSNQAGGSGGGGAGQIPGDGGYQSYSGQRGEDGTTEAGGDGNSGFGVGGGSHGPGGDGGDPGQDGADGSGPDARFGGDAGIAIDGDTYVDFTDEGDIKGPRIN